MLRQWLPFTSSGYPSTQTGPATLTLYLKYPGSVSLISPYSFFRLSSLLSAFPLYSFPSSSFLFPFPLFIHLSPLLFVIHHSLVLFFPHFPPFPLLFSFSHLHSSLFCLKFPPCGCVLLTSHLLWCELHICEWMTGKINNPAFPFSLTVGLSNE